MKIKATKKLLNVNRINAVSDPDPTNEALPGEWYAELVSTGLPGKLAIYFLHYPTLITIVIPGKSLNKALTRLPEKIESYLKRHRFLQLLPKFDVHSAHIVHTTNNRSMLGYLKDGRSNVEYNLRRLMPINDDEFERVEDIESETVFRGKLSRGKYVSPRGLLIRYGQTE